MGQVAAGPGAKGSSRDREGQAQGRAGVTVPNSRLRDDVSVRQRGAGHGAHAHGARDVAEAAAQVPPADGQQRAPLQGPSQRLDLQHQGAGRKVRAAQDPRMV